MRPPAPDDNPGAHEEFLHMVVEEAARRLQAGEAITFGSAVDPADHGKILAGLSAMGIEVVLREDGSYRMKG